MKTGSDIRALDSGNSTTADAQCIAIILALMEFAKVGVEKLGHGGYWVTTAPLDHAPLWWFGSADTLLEALQQCQAQAVHMRFMKAALEPAAVRPAVDWTSGSGRTAYDSAGQPVQRVPPSEWS